MSRLLCRRAALMALLSALAFTSFAHAASNVVISQVYGGGGNSGATYTNDFIELFNRGGSPVSLSGWSVQYASAAGTSWQVTTLTNVTLQPGQYYLVQQAAGAGGTTALPTPDRSGTIAMSGTAGKVALANQTSALTGACPTLGVIDFVGYGGANCSEGAPTGALSNTTAAIRNASGCSDTDQNNADFTVEPPSPRNSSSTMLPCGGPPVLSIGDATVTEGNTTVTASFTVSLSAPAPAGGVSFNIATQDDTATTADNDYVGNATTGSIIEGEQSYQFDVVVNGDTNVEPTETFFVNISSPTNGAVLGDAQGTGTITNDDFPPVVYDVVISQVYGGGGNSGTTLTHDFIELFNRGTTTVNLSGWSVQYASSTGASWQVTSLTGSIAPGSYYLVRQATAGGGSTALPTPDATGNIAMAAGSGKVALVSSTTPLSGACPTGAVDLVGYGSANCSEGAGPAAALSNTSAALRKRGGCFDSNNNSADFSVGQPTPRNSSTATRSCEYVPAAINQIQGSGLVTPYFGQDVTTTGIITARKANGFFLQTADAGADADTATSEGLFVFTSSAPSAVAGDFVTVKGTATEFFNLTQLESTLPGDVTVSSSGNTLPTPIVLTSTHLNPAGSPSQLERLEGMRVHADTLVSVAPTNDFNETDTVLPGVARPMREPGIDITLDVPPDPNTGLVDCCIPRWDRNPERIMVDGDGLAGATFLNVTSNVTLSNVTGPLDFTFGDYKILPETLPSASALMSAVPVPAPLTGDFTLAGFNIENFTGNATQRRKAALAIRTVLRYPDVMGHVEIGSLAALEALATQVNDDAVAAGDPNPEYEARLIPFGTGSQHLGFLVKGERVQIDSLTQSDPGTFFNPDSGQNELLHDRPPLILRATVDPGAPNRRPVIIVLVHMRSFIDTELVSGDGPRVRAKRTAQAESLAALLQQLQTDNPATPVMALGDYNAFEFNDGYTDPLSVIKGTPTSDNQIVVGQSPDLVTPDFVNLTETLPAGERYSFVFEGTPQALDHVLVNGVTQGYVTRYTVGRNNADFPEVPSSLFSGDVTRPERASDHDMPIAYFRFPSITGLTVDKPVLTPADHRMVDVLVSYATNDRCGTVTKTLSVTSNEPIEGLGDGDTAPDWEVIDGHHLRLRAERGGSGKGRVYTITVTATDSCGLVTQETITVTVPRDQRK